MAMYDQAYKNMIVKLCILDKFKLLQNIPSRGHQNVSLSENEFSI